MSKTNKQIVTFELKLGDTPIELLARLAPDQEKIDSFLNINKYKFDEMVIINTDIQLIFYLYTDDYLPLVELLDSHGIGPWHFELLDNTKESIQHFHEFHGRLGAAIKEEKKLLSYLKKSYAVAETAGTLGTVLKHLIGNGISTCQLTRKENPISKFLMALVSKAMDELNRLLLKNLILTITPSHEMTQLERIKVTKAIVHNQIENSK
jgi:glutamyl-tRNA reductase